MNIVYQGVLVTVFDIAHVDKYSYVRDEYYLQRKLTSKNHETFDHFINLQIYIYMIGIFKRHLKSFHPSPLYEFFQMWFNGI